ncbi:lipoprotein [Spiroplasma melliferum]|uniref:Lipoprotein n=2 Tax=Spiroplasma melliferum TaxID=2134 RepID=A0AAI9T326_SPIME|nr:lipoprotein [Spiroplasma melliferum]KAI92508.1 hypothetical protein SPM_004175 [Spiroplasma melliferum KC3]QCO23955.1 Spiroplasmavirus-related protein [Spiroplasma melliferum]
MKKLLSILGTIGLTATSTTTLISCEKPNNNENGGNKPEQQKPPEESKWKIPSTINKPLNGIDNKYYIVIWRNSENSNWKINKFLNNQETFFIDFDSRLQKSKVNGFYDLGVLRQQSTMIYWHEDNGNYFKSVYYWDGNGEPKTPDIDNNGKITNWKE